MTSDLIVRGSNWLEKKKRVSRERNVSEMRVKSSYVRMKIEDMQRIAAT